MIYDPIKTFLKDKEYRDLLSFALIILMIGTIVYHYVEGWSWLDSFYFSFITLTTIGFGDFYPITNIGKIFTIVYVVVGVGIILAFINTIHFHSMETLKEKYKDDSEQQK